MTDAKGELIHNESEYRDVAQTLSSKKRPPALLRKLMNSFETYRQGKKYGWSRPWNKYDLMNFQSFKLDRERDEQLFQMGEKFLLGLADRMPADAVVFCRDLLGDTDALMGFVFCHEFTEGTDLYEGATLSFGRVNDKRYRDRIDIIVESRVVDGVGQGLERVRVYVDPYRPEDKEPLWQATLPGAEIEDGQSLFASLSALSWEWADLPERHWDHWTSAYIDYFGDRQWPVTGSYFWVEGRAEARIAVDHETDMAAAAAEAV